jgi:hypothetical protein
VVVTVLAWHGVFRPLVIRPQGGVSRCDDLAGPAKLWMIDVHPVVDDRDRDPGSTGDGVGRLDVDVRIDRHVIHGGRLQVPLLREDLLPPPLLD